MFLADHAGFCFGVQRALSQVEKAVQTPGAVYTYGPLIHNPQVVERLNRLGVAVIDDLALVTAGRVVIRSHGVGPVVYREAEQRGLAVVDLTCPFVRKVQAAAHQFTATGYQVVIAGEAQHPEVAGIVAWTAGKALVAANAAAAENLAVRGRVALLAQTTLQRSTFREIEVVLRRKTVQLTVQNTICSATVQRQEAAGELAGKVDVMVVVGGRNSSNTRKLALICAAAGVPTYHIEEPNELCSQWFERVSKVGVTAGASTPHWIIEEVIHIMTELNQEQKQEEKVISQDEAMENPVVEAAAEPEVSTADPEPVTTEGQAASLEPATDPTPELDATATEPEVEDMGKSFAASLKELKEGDLITGVVVKVSHDEILVDVGGKSEGVVPLREVAPRIPDTAEGVAQVGDEIKVVVLKAESEDGTMVLSRRRAIEREKILQLQAVKENGEIVTGEVIAVVKGGLRVDVGIMGFVPASQIERGYVENLEKYVGQTFRMKVMEIDSRRNNAVLSQRAVLEEEYQEARTATWQELEEGQIRKGTVRRLTNFGAFVDIGGVDGLLHVSELSWGRVKHPGEVVKEGDEIEVYVLKVDREKEKVSLSLKQVLPNPWTTVVEKYPVDSIITVKVVRLTPFGAFAELEPGVDGLIHISQLANYRVNKPEDVVQVDQLVKVLVLDVKQAERRISLSMREVEQDFDEEESAEYADEEIAPEADYDSEE
ncbi:MAG: bifunctional 4-hydroxy-3-methylbut-2-enyl diphosphate reductase/30S ribosomal protein S1 [Heliobacteriaceae bacterium]|nr:bifunctional 4-hydroxy-3-methylbut-2-enyl diphosphate reductase/30S ribosomal protein S1 [Heliobacteriaceae bacterium]MDD4587378.1 bifunctional 4-hydroxy-3-methylbut-2-enyl diphosphate reductase/30S ribosomal protein S1 [Heliobacteriaceae bacterium]